MKETLLKLLSHFGLRCYLSEFRRPEGRLWSGPNYWAFSRRGAESRAKRNGHTICGPLICEVPCDIKTEVQLRRNRIRLRKQLNNRDYNEY